MGLQDLFFRGARCAGSAACPLKPCVVAAAPCSARAGRSTGSGRRVFSSRKCLAAPLSDLHDPRSRPCASEKNIPCRPHPQVCDGTPHQTLVKILSRDLKCSSPTEPLSSHTEGLRWRIIWSKSRSSLVLGSLFGPGMLSPDLAVSPLPPDRGAAISSTRRPERRRLPLRSVLGPLTPLLGCFVFVVVTRRGTGGREACEGWRRRTTLRRGACQWYSLSSGRWRCCSSSR